MAFIGIFVLSVLFLVFIIASIIALIELIIGIILNIILKKRKIKEKDMIKYGLLLLDNFKLYIINSTNYFNYYIGY